jgi:hypothetical protein
VLAGGDWCGDALRYLTRIVPIHDRRDGMGGQRSDVGAGDKG